MKTVLTLRGHTQHVTAVDFGRSRFLVSGSSGDKGDAAKLWDFRAVLFDPATASSAGIGVPQTADAFWRRLGSEDPAQVYAVMAMMAANSDAALPLIDEILRSITNALTPEQVAELIEELNHDAYDTREAAYQRLLRRRASIREQLAAALDENVPLEVQTRLEWILATKADVSLLTDEARRRLVRLVHLLETIGNTAARDYLDLLAAGHADEEIVAAAQAALHRLGQPELSEFVRQAQPNQ